MRERRDIPLGPLDVATKDFTAADGLLRAVVNMVPFGPAERPYYSPVETAAPINTELTGVLALGKQIRQQHGPNSSDQTAGLERLIAVTASAIHLIDPSKADPETKLMPATKVYDFATVDETRKAQFAAVGDTVFIAVSHGLGVGDPEHLLVLKDDVVRPFAFPRLPRVTVTQAETEATAAVMGGQVYSYRWAWLLKDGSFSAPERPILHYVSGDVDKHYELTFTIWLIDALDEFWSEIIAGVAIFLSPQKTGEDVVSPNLEKKYSGPWYHIATVATPASGESVRWTDAPENIPTYPDLVDEALTYHEITAAAVGAFNKRLLLGDVQYQIGKPVMQHNISESARGAGTYQVRASVKVKTANGSFERLGDPMTIKGGMEAAVPLTNGTFVYPDRRASELTIWANPGTGWVRNKTFRMRPVSIGNLAVSAIGELDLTTNTAEPMPDEGDFDSRDRDVNRMLTSSAYKPMELLARRALYVGNGPEDVILGFASNALPISTGQFGQYPLFVLCNKSVWSLEAGSGDVAWSSVKPVSKRGCVSRYGFTNIDTAVAFASSDGVWMLRPQLDGDPISKPLHYNNAVANDLFGCLTAGAALGYYNDKSRGRRELWVSTGVLTFSYAFAYDRWSILDRGRTAYCDFDNVLLGVNLDDHDGLGEGLIMSEGAKAEPIAIYLRTARLSLDGVGAWKRLYQLWVRERLRLDELAIRLIETTEEGLAIQIFRGALRKLAPDALLLPYGMVLHPFVELLGIGRPGQGIESIGFDFDYRLTHRGPETMPELDDDDPNVIQPSEVPWDCVNGIADVWNRPPYFVLENILWLPRRSEPPYCDFENVYVGNEPPWWAWTDEDLAATQWNVLEIELAPPGTPPYCEFDDIVVNTSNRRPYFELVEVRARVPEPGSGDPGSPNLKPTIEGPATAYLTPTSSANLEYLITDLDDKLTHIEVLSFQIDLGSIYTYGSNDGVEWNFLPTTKAGPGVYYNATSGYKMKRVLIGLSGAMIPIGTRQIELRATDTAGETTIIHVEVTVTP